MPSRHRADRSCISSRVNRELAGWNRLSDVSCHESRDVTSIDRSFLLFRLGKDEADQFINSSSPPPRLMYVDGFGVDGP